MSSIPLQEQVQHSVGMALGVKHGTDLAGAFGIPLGEIILAKLQFNAKREDHKVDTRLASGGKAY